MARSSVASAPIYQAYLRRILPSTKLEGGYRNKSWEGLKSKGDLQIKKGGEKKKVVEKMVAS